MLELRYFGLESEDFETLSQLVLGVANEHCGGKLVSLLEGGYNVEVLAECVAIHLTALNASAKPQ